MLVGFLRLRPGQTCLCPDDAATPFRVAYALDLQIYTPQVHLHMLISWFAENDGQSEPLTAPTSGYFSIAQ
jgi:hypothetical protein